MARSSLMFVFLVSLSAGCAEGDTNLTNLVLDGDLEVGTNVAVTGNSTTTGTSTLTGAVSTGSSVTAAGPVIVAEQSAPTQTASHGTFYTATDGRPRFIDSSGNDSILARGATDRIMAFSLPLTGVTDNTVDFTGTFREQANTQAGDYATDFALANNHLCIYVDDVTTGGDIVITGVSLSESTAAPVAADTETITIDTSVDQYYQSAKKWWEITNIDVSSGDITGIDADYIVCGYADLLNMDWQLAGYRIDAWSASATADFALKIRKIQDDGSGKMSIVDIEDIGVDSGSSGNAIADNLRTGANDRTLNPAVNNIWPNNAMLVFKMSDFNTYFTSDENIFESSTKDEGIIVTIVGEPSGGISGVDFLNLQLFYEVL